MRLEPALLASMRVPAWRQEARKRVVASYFPPDEQVALYAALGMPVPSSDELAEVREDAEAYRAQLSRGRDARFKVSVISGYHFTCALTGYRLIASGRPTCRSRPPTSMPTPVRGRTAPRMV